MASAAQESRIAQESAVSEQRFTNGQRAVVIELLARAVVKQIRAASKLQLTDETVVLPTTHKNFANADPVSEK